MNSIKGLRIALVGPLPPPAGGMATQTLQLKALLESEGAVVDLVQVNAPYRPAWAGRIPVARAAFRLIPYWLHLRQACRRANLVHLMANSGWAWHLFAMPAVRVAAKFGTPIVINYRGGEAEEFFQRSFQHVEPWLKRAAATVVPSGFLHEVFRRYGAKTTIVPNIIDLSRFSAREVRAFGAAPHIVVTRNLEKLYDIGTALRAFALLREHFPQARLSVAGSGPERAALEQLAASLSIGAAVTFTGMLKREDVAALYASADVMLNPSLADNMPNSVLEALASGVPVVSTNVGGIPFLLQDGANALLVPPGDPQAMASAALRVLREPTLASRLRAGGQELVAGFSWPRVRERWLAVYGAALGR